MTRALEKQKPNPPDAQLPPAPSSADAGLATAPSTAAVTAALAGMAAAWAAAGSIGMMIDPLRDALVWLAVAVAVVAGWPRNGRPWLDTVWLAAAVALAAVLTLLPSEASGVLAVAVVLAALARALDGADRRLLAVSAAAVAVFGGYRLALASIPGVWLAADGLGLTLGGIAAGMWGRPLWVGATFGGVDFLVLMAAVLAGWLISTEPPWKGRAICAVLAILVAQLACLTVLTFATDLAEALPEPPLPPETDLYQPPPWNWSEAAASLFPWNVPLVGLVLQLVVAAAMFRWSRWKIQEGGKQPEAAGPFGRVPTRVAAAALVLAATAGPLATLWLGKSDLEGKTVVAFAEGYLDWEKPVYDSYGQYSAGMYGMLPSFVASLGGRLVISDDLADEDLSAADVLVLLHPTKPWPEDRVGRVWEYVRSGGSLLVVGEPRVNEDRFTSAFEEVLAPGRLRIRYDTVVPRAGRWEDSLQALAHPATVGVDNRRGRFGMVKGSSLEVRFPGRPMLAGRWGWSDPGSDALETDVYRFDAGEKLGDLVLAAEERFGRGRVVVLGDVGSMTNLGNVGCYPFTGRLLAYLAGDSSSPQSGVRQALAVLAWLGLAAVLVWFRQPALVAAAAVLMALAAAGATAVDGWKSSVLPDTEKAGSEIGIACIDASHVEAYNDYDWTHDDIAGLKLTLMRNGYLPLLLPELSPRRLAGADLLISIGPARRFTAAERRVVGEFVQSGGILIAMAGADRAEATNGLVDQFGLKIPTSPVRAGQAGEEPRPMGNFRTRFLDAGDYWAHVLFYAGWPIDRPPSPGGEVLVFGFHELPVIGARYVGEGAAVLIGDTEFAMNKNLEYVGGEPFDGGRENAHFWRWLLARLTDRPPWIPPKPQGGAALEAALKSEAEPGGQSQTTPEPSAQTPAEPMPLVEPDEMDRPNDNSMLPREPVPVEGPDLPSSDEEARQ